jgi:hypothetical protein
VPRKCEGGRSTARWVGWSTAHFKYARACVNIHLFNSENKRTGRGLISPSFYAREAKYREQSLMFAAEQELELEHLTPGPGCTLTSMQGQGQGAHCLVF